MAVPMLLLGWRPQELALDVAQRRLGRRLRALLGQLLQEHLGHLEHERHQHRPGQQREARARNPEGPLVRPWLLELLRVLDIQRRRVHLLGSLLLEQLLQLIDQDFLRLGFVQHVCLLVTHAAYSAEYLRMSRVTAEFRTQDSCLQQPHAGESPWRAGAARAEPQRALSPHPARVRGAGDGSRCHLTPSLKKGHMCSKPDTRARLSLPPRCGDSAPWQRSP